MLPLRPPADPDLPQTVERRAVVRYARRLETLWQLLGVPGRDLTSGVLIDLSVTGVGLLLTHPFEADTTLLIRVHTATQGWCTHLVRVLRWVEMRPGEFEVGCTFVKPLTAPQLKAFLEG